MKLLTKEILAKLPPLYSSERVSDPIVVTKFFTPDAGATWLVLEYDGKDRFFGYCDLGMGMGELGYFSLSELQSIRGILNLPVERDLYWEPKPLSQAKRELGI